jgi:hypothetical protein
MDKHKDKHKRDRKMLTLFFVSVLSLLIGMTTAIDDTVIALAFQVVLMIVQIVFLKNVLDTWMPETE